MLRGFLLFLFTCLVFPVSAEQTGKAVAQINAQACERIIGGESRSSTRIRATDRAVFAGLKKLDEVIAAEKDLRSDEINVFIYRLVDEYVEDLAVTALDGEEGSICVRISGKVHPDNILRAKSAFTDTSQLQEPDNRQVAQAAQEAEREISVKPDDPENLALVHIQNLVYYNGKETAKFLNDLTGILQNSPYFYLTENHEVADYVLTPRVLKAKIDKLDAGHKRLQVVVTIDISGLGSEIISEYENRFVLFGAEEDEQQIAARLIRKLLEDAGQDVLRRIEHHEQIRYEEKTLGKTISG